MNGFNQKNNITRKFFSPTPLCHNQNCSYNDYNQLSASIRHNCIYIELGKLAPFWNKMNWLKT
jgi:hypothetical protein